MKVLITGGAGYIGSVLAPQLLSAGHEVTVFDNFMYKQTPLLDVMNHPSFDVIKADVRDLETLKAQVSKADAIIPLAALVGAPLCDQLPREAQEINADVIKKICDWKSKDQRLIYPCTNSGYGIGEEGQFCDENSPLRPISLYGRVKVEAESYLLESQEAVCFRFATLFGAAPRMRLDLLVNDFTYRAINDRVIVLYEAHFKRNYLYVREGARALAHALDNYETMKGQTYNVGLSDANLSKQELCEVIKRHVDGFQYFQAETGKDPDQRNYIVSNKKIEATGFKAEVGLDQGVKELAKAFRFLSNRAFSNV